MQTAWIRGFYAVSSQMPWTDPTLYLEYFSLVLKNESMFHDSIYYLFRVILTFPLSESIQVENPFYLRKRKLQTSAASRDQGYIIARSVC